MLSVPDLRPVPAAVRAGWRAQGLVGDASLSLLLSGTAARWPDAPAVADLPGGRALTWARLDAEVRGLTAWLRARGCGRGDVVVVQSPNALEALVAWWAAWQLGGVCVPVVDIYRRHELEQVVEAVRPAAVVTTAAGRDAELPGTYDALTDRLRAKVVIDGEAPGWTPWSDACGPECDGGPERLAPDDPALVLFTSGTTARAKGVVHTSRTLTAEAAQFVRSYGLSWRDTLHLPVPLAHVTGLILGLLVPGSTGCRVVLSRMRGLRRAAEEAVEHGATLTVGPPAELEHLIELLGERPAAERRLRAFATGGSSVTAAELEAADAMGLGPARSYGMTECPSVTTPGGLDPAAVRLGTDGPLPPGVECEAVDPDSRAPLAPGEEGELRVRGPERMLGYLDGEQTLAAVDADGWFHSGDLGVCDGRTVRVTGRIKDIINRGGEKFSASDIEAVLRGHDVVADAAVVAAPDARYGEVPVAFLVAREGAVPPDPSVLSAWVLARGMAAQKTPVRFSWVPELPTTPSGKVKKFELLAAVPPAEEVQP